MTGLLAVLFSLSAPKNQLVYALSVEEERKMGQEFMVQVRKNFELLEDDFANAYINRLGSYLADPLETRPFPFRFYIIKDQGLNAFAGPGGHIFVFSGLVEMMDSVDELAGVLCHEIGHITARHLSERLEQSQHTNLATLAGILAGVLIGGPVGGALVSGSMAAGIQAQLQYSRNDERQADQLAFTYIESSNFDPKGLLRTLNTIDKGNWASPKDMPAYLMTHPTGPERMANLDNMLKDYPPQSPSEEVQHFRSIYPFFKASLVAKSHESSYVERIFLQQLEKRPGYAPAHFALGLVYTETAKYPQAIRHLKQVHTTLPEFIPALTHLGEVYQMSGQSQEAMAVLERALTLDPDNKNALFLLGITYENLEDYTEAAALFERLASMPPVKEEVYYHLGIAYGRQNVLSAAHYNFGRYFKLMGKPDKAQFHFKKALGTAEESSMREKIREAEKGLR